LSKPKLQARLKSLSFSEKIKILEKLRDRERAIATAGLRRKPSNEPPNKGGEREAGVGRRQWTVEQGRSHKDSEARKPI
jgi:hypothetical protein